MREIARQRIAARPRARRPGRLWWKRAGSSEGLRFGPGVTVNGKPEPSGKRAETCLARHAYYAAYTIVPHVSVPGTPRRDMNEEMGVTDSCTVNSKSRPGHMYCLDCDPRVCTMRVQTKTRGAYSVQYLELASPSIFAEGGIVRPPLLSAVKCPRQRVTSVQKAAELKSISGKIATRHSQRYPAAGPTRHDCCCGKQGGCSIRELHGSSLHLSCV